MEEALIEAVRGKTCLYDIKHPDYVKTALKDSIWQQIARDLKIKDGYEAKRAWEKLRNNHRDALRRQKKIKTKLRSWRFQESMEFLVPYIGIRTSQSHPKAENDDSENTVQCENDESENEKNEKFEQTCVTDGTFKKMRRENRSIKEYHKREDKLRNRNDPMFHFFMSMYETTRRLPTLSQYNIKKKIFDLVTEEELQNLEQCTSPHPISINTQNDDSDAGTYDSMSSPAPAQQDEITIKEEVPDAFQSLIINF